MVRDLSSEAGGAAGAGAAVKGNRDAEASPFLRKCQQQLLFRQSSLQPQLLPPQPPQQHSNRMIIMIHHRQEQLFPELNHMNVTSRSFLSHSMPCSGDGNLTYGKILPDSRQPFNIDPATPEKAPAGESRR